MTPVVNPLVNPPPSTTYRAGVRERLVIPTDDLFAWTLTGRGSFLTHPDDDPRSALSRERLAVRHLLAAGHHVSAVGPRTVADLLGALTLHDPHLPADAEALATRLQRDWTASAAHRRTLTGPAPAVPDDDCDRRAATTLLHALPVQTLVHLLRWTAEHGRPHRNGWPTHLVHDGPPGAGRFAGQAHLLHVTAPGQTLTAAQRTVARACQDAGLELLVLRVNPLADVPCPTEADLGLRPAPPRCPSCPAPLDVEPPAHLLPGERPLPPFLHPGVPEERHEHHLLAHLAATTGPVSAAVAALDPAALQREAFALLTHPDLPATARRPLRTHLQRATARHRALARDPHLPHEQDRAAHALRTALTSWTDPPAGPAADPRSALRTAATAAGTHLALTGHDVLAIHDATDAVNHLLRTHHPDPPAAQQLFQMLSAGITGDELLHMHATGTYPDPDTLDLLAALRA